MDAPALRFTSIIMPLDDFTDEQREAVQHLLDCGYVVEVKSPREVNVYLKEYDDHFVSGSADPYEISQIHGRKREDSPFAARILLSDTD